MHSIAEKSDGLFGLMTCLTALQAALSAEEFQRFCNLTPNGEELWLAFRKCRDAPDAPKDYNFVSYGHEILAQDNTP